MPQAKERLRNLKVREVSLVDEGDNPGARIVLFKRRAEKQPTPADASPAGMSDEERRRRRSRPRGPGRIDGRNDGVAKARATTSENEGHTHVLEFPDGQVAAGVFITNEADGHTHPVQLPDLQPGDQTDVETGQADGHTHSVRVTAVERVTATRKQEGQDFKTEAGTRFRRNAYAFAPADESPSNWRLRLFETQADADANRPSIRLTAAAAQALGPSGFRGQRVQLPSGARAGAITRVRNAWLRARRQADQDVSREDLPAVLKRGLFEKFTETIRAWSGKEPDDDLEKRLFDDVRAERLTDGIADALMSRVGDLAQSVREILFGPESAEENFDAEGAVAETLKQFSSAMDDELAGIFAGQITKRFDPIADGEPGEDEIADALRDLFTTTGEPAPGATHKEGQMDLSKLSKEDRAEVEAALEKAGTADDLTTKLAASEAEVVKLKGDEGGEDDPLESLPEDVRKVVDPLLKNATDAAAKTAEENTDLRKRLDKIETDTARTTFEKTVGNLEGLPQKRDELVDVLWTMTDEDARSTMQKNLEAAAAAARRGNVFGEIGSGMGDGGGSAYAKIEAAASEIRKANPKLSEAEARAQAMNEQPDLYDAYLEEQDAATPLN